MDEIYSGANPDLQNFSRGQREDALTDFSNGLRISEHADQPGINMISVQAHHDLVAHSMTAIISCLRYSSFNLLGCSSENHINRHTQIPPRFEPRERR